MQALKDTSEGEQVTFVCTSRSRGYALEWKMKRAVCIGRQRRASGTMYPQRATVGEAWNKLRLRLPSHSRWLGSCWTKFLYQC